MSDAIKMSLMFLVDTDLAMPDAKPSFEQTQAQAFMVPLKTRTRSPASLEAEQPATKRAKRSSSASSDTSCCRADLHAQMTRYGPKLFMKDADGKYSCFFENCEQRMSNNFSRHVYGHEQRGDRIKSSVKSTKRELCFVDQTPTCQYHSQVFGVSSGPSSPMTSPPASPNSTIITPTGSPMGVLTSSPGFLPLFPIHNNFVGTPDFFSPRDTFLSTGGFKLAPPKYT